MAGSHRGAGRTALMATLVMGGQFNDIDPRLADVLATIADTPIGRLEPLLPSNGTPVQTAAVEEKRVRPANITTT